MKIGIFLKTGKAGSYPKFKNLYKLLTRNIFYDTICFLKGIACFMSDYINQDFNVLTIFGVILSLERFSMCDSRKMYIFCVKNENLRFTKQKNPSK